MNHLLTARALQITRLSLSGQKCEQRKLLKQKPLEHIHELFLSKLLQIDSGFHAFSTHKLQQSELENTVLSSEHDTSV